MSPSSPHEWTVLDGADFRLEVDDEQIAALLRPGRVAEPAPERVAPSEELRAVTHRISSQFLDVLHVTAGSLFAGRDARGSASQLVATLDALDRLAAAARDDAHRALLAEIHPLAVAFAEEPRGRVRERFLGRLRSWVVRYADHLGPEEGRRFRELVRFDARQVPLFAELASIPGIGPRRLVRLFCAGLYAVDVVSGSDPREVAQVTGLPRALAADVVDRARRFQEEHRRRTVMDMRARLAEFQRALAAIDPATNAELWAVARSAVQEMQSVVHRLSPESVS